MPIYRFCPQCGKPLDTRGRFPTCSHCQHTYYRNAKPCASILPIRGNEVLLARRGVEPFKGAYDTIGGFLEEDEHPAAGALREAREETGVEMRIIDLLGLYIDRYGADEYTLTIHYVGEIVSGDPVPHDDVAALEWLPIDNLPVSDGFQNTNEGLQDLQRWFARNRKD